VNEASRCSSAWAPSVSQSGVAMAAITCASALRRRLDPIDVK
jgi:hypothetical protein